MEVWLLIINNFGGVVIDNYCTVCEATPLIPVLTLGYDCNNEGSLIRTLWNPIVSNLVIITVEPPNKGHVGTSHFVLCREVVLSLKVDNVLVHLGPQEVSFIE